MLRNIQKGRLIILNGYNSYYIYYLCGPYAPFCIICLLYNIEIYLLKLIKRLN